MGHFRCDPRWSCRDFFYFLWSYQWIGKIRFVFDDEALEVLVQKGEDTKPLEASRENFAVGGNCLTNIAKSVDLIYCFDARRSQSLGIFLFHKLVVYSIPLSADINVLQGNTNQTRRTNPFLPGDYESRCAGLGHDGENRQEKLNLYESSTIGWPSSKTNDMQEHHS